MSVQLYHGDCLEFMRTLPASSLKIDAVITDQPYGTGWMRGGGDTAGSWNALPCSAEWDVWDTTWVSLVPSGATIAAFVPLPRLAEFAGMFKRHAFRFYIKSNPRPSAGDRPSVEPIVISPSVKYGDGPQHMMAYNAFNGQEHPTQKPLEVMEWLVTGLTPPGATVLDPFMGSGTTGVACVQTGRNFIGCEIDAGYFEIAQRRIALAQQQPMLPGINGPAPQPEQLSLV